MPGLFVTATGTDVGKTFVAAGLIRAARRAGIPVAILKPVLSGYDESAAARSDAGVLLEALGRPVTAQTVAVVAPWRFAAPLSPDMAAAAEGRTLDFAELVAVCHAALASDHLAIIEGVGGVMVPFDERHTVLDLMAALAMPVLLVAGSGLGGISHCLTAVAALASRRLTPTVIVLNETEGSTVPLFATARTLRNFCSSDLVVIPRRPSESVFDDLLGRLRQWAPAPSRADGSAA